MQSEQIESIVDLAATLASRADKLDQVLIIYRYKEDTDDVTHGSIDNGLTLETSLWLVEAFKFWLQAGATGLLRREEK
jgi:hypothetical protein